MLREAGEKLADGWCGAVWALEGDHDYKRDCLELANVNAVQCCSHCPADNTHCPWFHFVPGARWAKGIYATRALRCALFQMVGVGIWSVYPDWMHDKHLGTDKVPQQRRSHPNWIFHLARVVLYLCLIFVSCIFVVLFLFCCLRFVVLYLCLIYVLSQIDILFLCDKNKSLARCSTAA